jgi:hypothetical protein
MQGAKTERISLFQRNVVFVASVDESPQREVDGFPRAVYVVSANCLVEEVLIDLDLILAKRHGQTIPT